MIVFRCVRCIDVEEPLEVLQSGGVPGADGLFGFRQSQALAHYYPFHSVFERGNQAYAEHVGIVLQDDVRSATYDDYVPTRCQVFDDRLDRTNVRIVVDLVTASRDKGGQFVVLRDEKLGIDRAKVGVGSASSIGCAFHDSLNQTRKPFGPRGRALLPLVESFDGSLQLSGHIREDKPINVVSVDTSGQLRPKEPSSASR